MVDGEDVVLQSDESQPGVKPDFKLVVIWQVDRTAREISQGSGLVPNAVAALEGVVIGYLDKSDYQEKIKPGREAFEREKKLAEGVGKFERDKRLAQASYDFALVKWNEVMRVVYARILGTEEGVEA